jgi:hypothetical protein
VAAQLAASQEGLSSMSECHNFKKYLTSLLSNLNMGKFRKVFITFSYVNVTFSVNLLFFCYCVKRCQYPMLLNIAIREHSELVLLKYVTKLKSLLHLFFCFSIAIVTVGCLSY